MWFDDQEQRRTLAIVAIGPNASRFAARLCQVVARLYGGDPPIYAIGLHDSLATRSVAENTLTRVPGMRGRSFSLSGQQRRQLRLHLHDGERASDEAALAIIHHELIRRVHERRHPLENVLWIADGEYVSLCSDHIRRVRQVLDNTTPTALCLLDHGEEASASVIEELKTWGDIDSKTGQQIAAATILSSTLSSLGTSALGRYQNDLLAWGLASLLFAPLQDKNNPPFSSIVKRVASHGHALAALAIDTTAVPQPPQQGNGLLLLFGKPRLGAEELAAYLAERTRILFNGAPLTTYGALVYPEAAQVATPARAGVISGQQAYYGDRAASYAPNAEQAVGRPVQISYIQPLQPGDIRFERLASDLGSWIGSAYHLPYPSFLQSQAEIDLPQVADVLQGEELCQVCVLFGVDE
jgi:hypothetical protein